jgi:hypothetical protein
MPIGKKIHEVMSKKFKDKKKRTKDAAAKGPVEPATVDQFRKNKVARSKSLNIHIVDLAGPRQISPNEGMPAINGKSGEEVVKKAVTKVRPKTEATKFDGAGAIEQSSGKKQKKCGACREPGHTRRNCPTLH